jgi:uncharacterized protein (TIGR00251 family)
LKRVYRLKVHLQPRAASSRIVGIHGDSLKVQVQAAPVDSAANAALLNLLAAAFHVTRRAVHLVHGHSSRYKWVEIDADPGLCEARLAELIGAPVTGGRVDKE